MLRLASLSGDGSLKLGGKDLGAVTYGLEIWQDAGANSGDGELWGDYDLLWQAYRAGTVTLQLDGEKTVEITVNKFDGLQHAYFLTSGRVPGY